MTDARPGPGGCGSALIVGGDSLIGSAVRAHLQESDISSVATSRRAGAALRFDLAAPDFAPLVGKSFDAVFVCAAVTDMRACQDEPLATRRINVDTTIELMRRLADRGAHLVFFSTSQVFDGESPAPAEDAVPNPRNEYGAQKLAVERAIARYDLPAAILRVTKVLGQRPAGIFAAWLTALGRPEPVRAATNLALSPVAVADVAVLARRLAAGRHRGVWHLSAADTLTYADAARLLAQRLGRPSAQVIAESLTDAQVPSIYRLGNAQLACEKVEQTFNIAPKSARDVLDAVFAAATAGV
jgi:dTDP-4-dehydrorhamnose reductase